MSSRAYRLRPATRRATRGRPRTRIRWDRLGRIALVLVLFAVLASYINPVVNLVDTWRESRAEESRLADLKAENERLRARAEELKSPAGEQREARKLGLVGAGERPYVVRGLGD